MLAGETNEHGGWLTGRGGDGRTNEREGDLTAIERGDEEGERTP